MCISHYYYYVLLLLLLLLLVIFVQVSLRVAMASSASMASVASFASAKLHTLTRAPSLQKKSIVRAYPLRFPSHRIASKRGRNGLISAQSSSPSMMQQQEEEEDEEEERRRACSPSMMQNLIAFLEADLPHLFDERGITRDQYEASVQFRDPITKYDSIDGYLFNIQMLRYLFSPKFELHSVKQVPLFLMQGPFVCDVLFIISFVCSEVEIEIEIAIEIEIEIEGNYFALWSARRPER